MLLVAPGLTTRSKELLVAKGRVHRERRIQAFCRHCGIAHGTVGIQHGSSVAHCRVKILCALLPVVSSSSVDLPCLKALNSITGALPAAWWLHVVATERTLLLLLWCSQLYKRSLNI